MQSSGRAALPGVVRRGRCGSLEGGGAKRAREANAVSRSLHSPQTRGTAPELRPQDNADSRALTASAGASLSVLALCAFVCAGCCVPAPAAGKYFDREDPLSALKGFAYAIETEQWDYAYASLTKASREELGHFKFRVAIEFLSDPIGDASIYDLITNVFAWQPLAERRDQALVGILSRAKQSDGRLVIRRLDVELSYEEEEWRLDLLGTAERLASAQSLAGVYHPPRR